MAIPSRQIGQSAEYNMLWYISKQLERIAGLLSGFTTTTTTTAAPTTTTTTTEEVTTTTTTTAGA